MLRVRIVLDLGQSGLPAASPESINSESTDGAELDWEEKPSRRSVLRDIGTKMNVSSLDDGYKWRIRAHGKAFKISPITASLTFACMSSEFCSRVTLISACRWARVFWNRFAISVLRSSQASYSFGNRVLRPIVRIKVFKALSSRVSERHNTTSSSLEYNSLNAKLGE